MAQAEDSIKKVCPLDEINEGNEWVEVAYEKAPGLTKVVIAVKKSEVQDTAGAAEIEVRQIVEDNSRPSDPVVYTDGSVKRGVKSGWGFVLYVDGHILHRAAGACNKTVSSTRMEIEAVTEAFKLIVRSMPQAKHLVIVTDSQNLLKRVANGTLRREWIHSIEQSRLKKITWIYAPSHTGVSGNEMADKLANNAPLNARLKMDKKDVLAALTTTLLDEEMQQDRDAILRMEERGTVRGSGRNDMVYGGERRIKNQIKTGTISGKTLSWILRRGTEHLWECPECRDVVPGNK